MPQNAPIDHKTLLRRIAELEQRVKSLETSPRAGDTSVTNGKFVIRSGDVELLRAGYLGQGNDGSDVRGLQMRRLTGEVTYATWQQGSGEVDFWAWYDKAGNILVSDDAVSGVGLARPYVGSALFAPGDTSKWPTVTSSSFTAQWSGVYYKQHPQLVVIVWTQTASGTSGDIRVSCNGASVTQSVGSGDSSTRELLLDPPGNHEAELSIVIEMRRTGGSGFMGCYPMGCFGVQS